MNPNLYSIIQNPYFQQVVGYIVEQVLSNGYQRFRSTTRYNDARILLAGQLLSCLEKAYFDTCTHFGWEYNNSAIEELLKDDVFLSFSNNLQSSLINILFRASGADETGIADEDVINYWLDSFSMNLSFNQELYNYLNQNRNERASILPQSKIKSDCKEYFDAFREPLFLESAIGDGARALLKDVYIPAKYKVGTPEGEKRVDFARMLDSFFNAREEFTWQQDDRFPVIANRIFAIMIMGKPGSGKSSFVSYLSTLLPSMAKSRPYYIVRLRNMLKSQINSVDPIQGLLEYIGIERSNLVNSIVILDGLDEICALYQKTDFHTYLKMLLQNLSVVTGLQLVITSRTGYFRIDSAIENFCLTLHIENWDNSDLDLWSKKYLTVHPSLHDTIESNNAHLKDEKYSDKKAIFAVPILFYMANARGELLSNHKSICSVYDAVLCEVTDARNYDATPYVAMHEVIPQNLARQICIEIAFSMFRSGRLNYIDQADPFLEPDEVEKALSEAMQKCSTTASSLSDEEKKRIKDTYALTFYYNKDNTGLNAVEFAHKTIAEYFTSEKMLEILNSASEHMSEKELCEVLAECFGYAPVTTDIFLFLYERIKMEESTPKNSIMKRALERHFLNCVIDGNLFTPPKKYPTTVHYIDRIPIMIKSVLMLFEYLDCQPPRPDDKQKNIFNHVIASVSRMTAINSQHQSLLPLALNGFNLSDGDFTDGELSEVHLSGADLTHAVFSDANLTDGHLSGCFVNAADFSGANLAGADFTDIESGQAVDFTDASIQGADFSESHFVDASFDYADMQEAILEHSVFGKGCHFSEANLFLANLDNATINEASIENAVFVDEENADAEEESEIFTISHLTITQGQFNYISSFPQIELKDCIIVL